MHNIKEAIYENKSKLEGIGEDYQVQVSVLCEQKCLSKRRHLTFNCFCCSIYVMLNMARGRQKSKEDAAAADNDDDDNDDDDDDCLP